jgi:uroporphyrinogen-III decarboxylase
MPVKRIMFPMHKGMDGFMSPAQYEKLYWKPFRKVIDALIDMGVTPYLYTEGRYYTRLEQLADVPKGKVLFHFETVDMKEAKHVLGNTGCIAGNLPIAMLEFGKKQEVVDYCKFLIDTCAPGGGYIFDLSARWKTRRRKTWTPCSILWRRKGKA